MSRARLAVITLITLIVVAGAITAAVLASRPSGHAASATSSQPGDLRHLLLSRSGATDGVLTLDQAAQITHPEADSKAQLQALGFQRGAIAQWHEGEVEVVIRLFQFPSAAQAQDYQDAVDATFAPSFFDEHPLSSQVTGGHAYVSNRALDGRGFLGSANAVRGNIFFQIARYQPTSDAAPVIDLATSQYALLPA